MSDPLRSTQAADWYYDDRRQVGLDFADPVQVTTYDARQGSTDAAAAQLLRDLGVAHGAVLADIGCGTGVLACQAALLGCQVTAIDISDAMLQATQSRAGRLGARGVATEKAGFLTFAASPASIDVVTTQYALHHVNDFWKLVALQRIHRALKPGGLLFLRDVVFSCDPSALPETIESWLAWMQVERGYSREENATHVREEHSTFSWIMEGLLERAGFRIDRPRYTRGVYASFVARKP
ncbi:MAG: class I SAM-dependent methyltransferase [Vicinamibacterales bacterium]